MNNDKATVFGKEVDLNFSTSSHYCINIIPAFHECKPCNEMILMLENNISDKQKFKQIPKINKQLGHAWKENIKKVLSNANLMSSDLKQTIYKLIESCETCKKIGKLPSNHLLP